VRGAIATRCRGLLAPALLPALFGAAGVRRERLDEPLDEVRELGDVLVKAAEANVALIGKLSKLRGIEPELQAVDRLESEADRIYRRSVAHLFSGDFNAFDVLRWKDIVEAIEESINGLEKISDVVESIALKHN
jgi:uncharacterized protein Yka (UPF0111/DUF47 family)